MREVRCARPMAAVLTAAVLLLISHSPAFAQNQLPLDFRGVTYLETGPNWLSGPEDDLASQRSHAGHAAADVRPALRSAGPAAAALSVTTAPRTRAQRVVSPDRSFSGFPGLTHFDQRFAGTGAYTNTQFSLEPPDQGLCVGHGFVMEAVNNALAVYNSSGKLLSGPTALSQFFQLQPEIIRSSPPGIWSIYLGSAVLLRSRHTALAGDGGGARCGSRDREFRHPLRDFDRGQ